jgi:hypothetical protein
MPAQPITSPWLAHAQPINSPAHSHPVPSQAHPQPSPIPANIKPSTSPAHSQPNPCPSRPMLSLDHAQPISSAAHARPRPWPVQGQPISRTHNQPMSRPWPVEHSPRPAHTNPMAYPWQAHGQPIASPRPDICWLMTTSLPAHGQHMASFALGHPIARQEESVSSPDHEQPRICPAHPRASPWTVLAYPMHSPSQPGPCNTKLTAAKAHAQPSTRPNHGRPNTLPGHR